MKVEKLHILWNIGVRLLDEECQASHVLINVCLCFRFPRLDLPLESSAKAIGEQLLSEAFHYKKANLIITVGGKSWNNVYTYTCVWICLFFS